MMFGRTQQKFSDLIPFFTFARAHGITFVLNTNNTYQCTLEFRGVDADSQTEASYAYGPQLFAEALKDLCPHRATIWIEERRDTFDGNLHYFPKRNMAAVDALRTERINQYASQSYFHSSYYLTVVFNNQSTHITQQVLEDTAQTIFTLRDALQGIMQSITPLDCDQTSTYLHSATCWERGAVRIQEHAVLINRHLVDVSFQSGATPKVGEHYTCFQKSPSKKIGYASKTGIFTRLRDKKKNISQ